MSERLLTIKEVKERTGMSHTWIYEQIEAGSFPKQRHLGKNVVRWIESEVNEWIKALPSSNSRAA
ncbi:helix-turn-helix transcriptional regulator [Chromobacterium piscinae]|uniref:helix-turn-helix transcriptional regulator n=1 Tax=Chromobacterium piscinae TaxID=686831 RepID=UPI003D1664B6